MDSNELRKGNWTLLGKLQVPTQVFSLTFDRREGKLINEIPESEFSGLPLSSELLMACSIKLGEWFIEDSYLVTNAIGAEGFDITVRNADHTTELTITYVKYLHQLQNVLFSLTGKEIEYTPS